MMKIIEEDMGQQIPLKLYEPLELEQIEQLKSMLLSSDYINIDMAMDILYNRNWIEEVYLQEVWDMLAHGGVVAGLIYHDRLSIHRQIATGAIYLQTVTYRKMRSQICEKIIGIIEHGIYPANTRGDS